MSVFGGAWWLMAAGALDKSMTPVVAIVGITLTVLLMRASNRALNNGAEDPSAGRGKTYAQVNVAQAIAIPVAVVIAATTGHPNAIAPLIAGIVGLHFLPFAKTFEWRGYTAQGLGLLVVSAIGGFVALTGADATTTRLVTAIGAVAVIWGGVGAMLAISGRETEGSQSRSA